MEVRFKSDAAVQERQLELGRMPHFGPFLLSPFARSRKGYVFDQHVLGSHFLPGAVPANQGRLRDRRYSRPVLPLT